MYVDPSQTVATPYSQGNELVFGQNAGQQCVGNDFVLLEGSSSANDLIQILNIGNIVFKFLSTSPPTPTVLFNADRITYSVKFACY